MSRPVHSRKIGSPPRMRGYRPYGMEKCRSGKVTLKLEEFESLRLVLYCMHPQDEASVLMNVSRPTFTRIYNKALKTIATALVEGKCLDIDGGNFSTEKEWYRCNSCNSIFEGSGDQQCCTKCNSAGNQALIRISKS